MVHGICHVPHPSSFSHERRKKDTHSLNNPTPKGAKCIIPDINDLEDYGQGYMVSLSKQMNSNSELSKTNQTRLLYNRFSTNDMLATMAIQRRPFIALYDTLGIRRTYSRLKPPASSRGPIKGD